MNATDAGDGGDQFGLRITSQTEAGLIKWVNITKGDVKWTRWGDFMTTNGRVEAGEELPPLPTEEDVK